MLSGSWVGFRYANEFRTQLSCQKWFWELPHVILENIGYDVGRNVGEVDKFGAVFKGLAQAVNSLLGSGHAINTLNRQAAGVDLLHTTNYYGRNLVSSFENVIAKIYSEYRNLSW